MKDHDRKAQLSLTKDAEAQDGALPSSVEQEKKPKKRSVWKRVVIWTLTTLFILAIAFAVLLFVHMKRTDKPFVFGLAVYRVVSESMEPTIMTSDVIIVEQVKDVSELKVGDIVTYRAKAGAFKNLPAGTPVTHRIVAIDGDTITTQGDNRNVSLVPDPAISFDDVIGRYVKTSAPLTKISVLLFSRYGFIIVVFIPLMILLVVQIVNFIRACHMDKDGKSPEERAVEEVKETAIKEKEEEIKRKAIEEYLASRKRIEKFKQSRSDRDRKEK